MRLPHFSSTNRTTFLKERPGFALIVAMSLVAFILMLLLSLTTLLRVDLQSSSVRADQSKAQTNALLGLQIAIAELQQAAGPDQRVTGTADLLTNVNSDEQKHWTGVWNVATQDPFVPFTAPTDVKWLVSGYDPAGNPLTPSATVADPVSLLISEASPESNVTAGRVEIDSSTGSSKRGHYAYWVGDEGVKAKVNTVDPFHDGSSTEKRFSQMSAQRTGIEAITIEDGGNRLGTLLDPHDSATENALKQLASYEDYPLFNSNLSALNSNRFHDITTTSYGVLADVKHGGLKKDLSLAFEMDLDDFNADETFAAGGETAPFITDHKVNYLFTFDHFTAPLPKVTNPLVRGPTWHLLRNYYRLYKENDPDRFQDYKAGHPLGVTQSGNGYEIAARSIFPMTEYNQPEASELTEVYYDAYLDPHVNTRFRASSGYEPIIRVTDMAISPVMTRLQLFISLQAIPIESPSVPGTIDEYRLELIMNPVVSIWNPYNVALSFDQFTISLPIFKMPIKINVTTGGTTTEYSTNLAKLIDPQNTSSSTSITMNLQGTASMEPGEIRVFSNIPTIPSGQFSCTMLPYSQSISDEPGFRFTQLKDIGTTTEELLVPPGAGLHLYTNTETGIGMKMTLYRYLSNGTERSAINNGGVSTEIKKGNYLEWPIAGDPLPSVEEVASTYYPYKHPIGFFDAHLRTTITDRPVQFLTHYNPRGTCFRQFTGPSGKGEDGIGVANYFGGMNSISNWFGEPAIATDGSGYWGDSITGGETRVVLFELPTMPLQSLAAFQHVNNIANYAQEPAYVVGNSYASPFIAPDAITRTIQVTETNPEGTGGRTQVDWSYLTNEALWDSYFFSSLAPRDDLGLADNNFTAVFQNYLDGNPLPNSRMSLVTSSSTNLLEALTEESSISGIAPEAYETIAANLMVDGAFNVNSTSVDAWRALLSSLNGIDITYLNGNSESSANDQDSPFARMSLPGGDSGQRWRGFRSLTVTQIDELAEAIVAQVKLRGPFTSLSDFVNRRLTTDSTAHKGPLQAAIDSTSINSDFSIMVTSNDLSTDMKYPDHAVGPAASGATGYLRQTDLLMAIGQVLSARSDTFTIRAYGDYVDVFTGNKSEALCEAVVQRIPDYVDTTDEPIESGVDLTTENQSFGRRFIIRSFRWLNTANL